MTSAYLILAHRNFGQLRRLIQRLLAGDSAVVVHIDKNVEVPRDLLAEFAGRAIFTGERFATAWGSFELVEATLRLLQDGIQNFPDARYFTLLSGQDYPIKSPEYIDTFFQQSVSNYILHWPLLQERWRYGGIRRINRFYWAKNRKSLPGFFFRTIPLPPRAFPIATDKIFFGSQWWSLRNETVRRLLYLVQEKPKLASAFQWTYIPDEMVFHTLIKSFVSEEEIENNNLRFIEYYSLPRDYWRLKVLNRNGIKSLDALDIEKLKNSSALFARKFDFSSDQKLGDMLDELCNQSGSVPRNHDCDSEK